ncbi:pyrroline-5-carboxylate reductase [Allostella vacuolata]|nr:pyrroline-5-carboxylate reductase [Stella vacuolata]
MGPLLLVGCGKMGGAMLDGWRARGLTGAGVAIVEPAADPRFAAMDGVAVHAGAESIPDDFNPGVVVLAVKPQSMDAVLPHYRRFAGPDTVFLSIAAGKTIAYFERALGGEAAIVRAMPNTPAAVGQGMTVAVANPAVAPAQRQACDALLAAVGDVAWVEDEGLIDAVTAVSGGGPAYVFLLIECLAEAGRAAGLPADLSMRLARTTVAGSGALVRQSEEPAATLRRNVTSPNGTTQEALAVLMAEEGGLQSLMTRAIAAATRRSRELAG